MRNIVKETAKPDLDLTPTRTVTLTLNLTPTFPIRLERGVRRAMRMLQEGGTTHTHTHTYTHSTLYNSHLLLRSHSPLLSHFSLTGACRTVYRHPRQSSVCE